MQIVTICTDTPSQIRKGRDKHGLRAVMLADPKLEVIDLYGLRNQGIQSGPPGRPQPVPTSILADGDGIVRWIDQSESYQRRSSPDVVLGALDAHSF